MGRNDMDHLKHLESVALSDCAVLENKEATYKGSWKRAGGRSAWFMARRNLDRMITMMEPPEQPPFFNMDNVKDSLLAISTATNTGRVAFPGTPQATHDIFKHLAKSFTAEDIFAMIAANPKGEDGTFLACMRDARRYFMLVEAEMISEGVVEPEEKTYEGDNYPQDIYTLIANDIGMAREEVKTRIHELFYREAAASPASSMDPGPAIGETTELNPAFSKVYSDGMVHEAGKAPRLPTEEECKELHIERSGGGYAREQAERHADKHGSLFPWHAAQMEYETLHKRVGSLVDLFYTKRAAGVYQLEPVVGARECPRDLALAYTFVGDNKWVMKRGKVPLDLEDNFPRMQLEMNHKEYEGSNPDFRFMYHFRDGPQKWMLQGLYEDWGRDVG